jgi:hypothetical protein
MRKSLFTLVAFGSSRTRAFAPSVRSYFSSTTLSAMSTKKVLVPIAEDSEEIETTCITDTLTRFGADVTIASVMPDLVCTMSRGIKVCDKV